MNMDTLSTNKTTDVRSRIEPELKDSAAAVLEKMGLNISQAFRLFLRQVVAQQALPFKIKAPNEVTVAAMKEARSIRQAKFGSAKKLFDDIEKNSAAKTRKAAKKKR
jgi:DNA-damage-inducible protein J